MAYTVKPFGFNFDANIIAQQVQDYLNTLTDEQEIVDINFYGVRVEGVANYYHAVVTTKSDN